MQAEYNQSRFVWMSTKGRHLEGDNIQKKNSIKLFHRSVAIDTTFPFLIGGIYKPRGHDRWEGDLPNFHFNT